MKLPFWPNPLGYRNIVFGLSRVYDLLDRVGNPHLKLPDTIHFAGTNGKGSTLSFLKTIFEESGLSVHTYTSPHLVNFNERIILAGKEIEDDFLTEILTECQQAAKQEPAIAITFFEGITVAAFLAFSRVKADLLLLETGMGGRLDATNILPEILCSVITPISLDHTEFLGNTIADIAIEKAGIIKRDCPTIVGKQVPEAALSIHNKALELNSDIKFFGKDWTIKKENSHFIFEGFNQKLTLPYPSLTGEHQIENASTAIAVALSQKKFNINEKNIVSAMKQTFWPARLQHIKSGTFIDALPKHYDLYLDGGHNVQASKAISEFLRMKKVTNKNHKIFVIFAMLEDKDCHGFLKEISNEINHLIALKIKGDVKSLAQKDILKITEKLELDSKMATNFDEAFETILDYKEESATILICGSLYLAGDFLAI